MRGLILGALVVAMLAAGAVVARADTLTFDDVPSGSVQNAYGDMPTYMGFDFSFTLDWADLVGTDTPYNFGAHSGDFGIINNNGGVGTIVAADGADFTFDGVWAKSYGTAADSGGTNSLFGTISGYNNGILVWSVSTGLNGSFQFFGAQAGLIDELRLGFGNHFMADDLVLNAPAAIPEPTTLALFGLGAGALALRRRRRKVA